MFVYSSCICTLTRNFRLQLCLIQSAQWNVAVPTWILNSPSVELQMLLNGNVRLPLRSSLETNAIYDTNTLCDNASHALELHTHRRRPSTSTIVRPSPARSSQVHRLIRDSVQLPRSHVVASRWWQFTALATRISMFRRRLTPYLVGIDEKFWFIARICKLG